MPDRVTSRERIAFLSVVLIALVTACSGGGGGGSYGGSSGGSGGGVISPASYTVGGTLTEFSAGSPIAGATITIGSLPASACAADGAATDHPSCRPRTAASLDRIAYQDAAL